MMTYKLSDIRKINVENKKVFLRLDLDVPLTKSKIKDNTRLAAGLTTIHYLLEQGAIVIICGHLGRPKGFDQGLSLEPVTRWIAKNFQFSIFNFQLQKIGNFDGWKLSDKLFLLENLRFFKGEEENDLEFAKKLASLADIYVNDAFAVCHRNHASITGVAKLLPHFAGLHLQKEVEALNQIIDKPKRPLVVLIGGVKIETKLPLVEKMHQFADYVLVGGKIAQETRELLKIQHEKIEGRKSILLIADCNEEGTDITEKSSENFTQVINIAKTIVWNGPMGVTNSKFEIRNSKPGEKDTEKGTKKIAEGIVRTDAYKVVGGGDTLEFLQKINLLSQFDFVSMGGGAMLSFLSGEKMPGLEALE